MTDPSPIDTARATASLVLAAPDRLLTDALTTRLDSTGIVEVTAAAYDGAETVLRTRVAQPALAVISTATPGLPLASLLQLISRYAPATRVVLLSPGGSGSTRNALFEQGTNVWGALPVDWGFDELLAELVSALRARRRPRPPVRRGAPRAPSSGSGRGPVTAREAEVLALVSDGLSTVQIAAELQLSAGTVKRHLANLYGKLGVHSRVTAVMRGAALGLIAAPSTPTHASASRRPRSVLAPGTPSIGPR